MPPQVLVMIPAYNEERTVGDVIKSTLDLYPEFAVVVIDDGSEDETARRAIDAGASVVSLPFHCGGSITIQTGYFVATRQDFDYVVKIDADGQHKPEEIPKLLGPLLKGDVDMTVGSRYLELNSEGGSMVKEGGRVFSSTLVAFLRKLEITDITSGMRAWNRKALETLLPMYQDRSFIDDSVFWVVETLLASGNGLRLKEVPVEVLPRKYGRSKSYSPPKMLLYPVRLLLTLIQEVRR